MSIELCSLKANPHNPDIIILHKANISMDISESIKIKNPISFKRHPWEIARRSIIRSLLASQKGFPFFHIADIGCGDGFILQDLLKNDAALHFSAIDPSFTDNILNRLKRLPHAETVQFYKEFGEIPVNNATLDCILLLDVLEHVADDKNLVTEIRQSAKIAKGACWIITVPAFQSLFSYHDRQLRHFRRYNLNQLSTLCKSCGLHIDKKGYFFFSLIPFRFIQKITSKHSQKHNDSTIQDWKGSRTLSALLSITLWIDFKVSLGLSNLRIHIPGLSCYCICH